MKNLLIFCGTFSCFLLVLQSCTVARIGFFFMPSVNDYKIFPTDTISAAKNSSPAFNEGIVENTNFPTIDKWLPEIHQEEAKDLDEFLEKSHTTSFLVVKNNQIILEKYANGHKKEDPQIIFSVSKAITAMLVVIAVKEGHLELDQKVSTWIPEYKDKARQHITIRHLMNMVSGLDFNDEKDLRKLSIFYYNTNQDKYIRKFDDVKYAPEEHFAYKSMATQVLAMCLEQATNCKLTNYLQDKLWEPLGMEYPALYTTDSKKGNNRAFGGLAVRSRDLLQLGKLLLNDGVWEGQQILPSFFTMELQKRKLTGNTFWGYNNCFWKNGYIDKGFNQDRDFFAAGFHGQYIYVNPDRNIIIVRQGKKERFLWRFVFARLAKAIDGDHNDLTNNHENYQDQFSGIYKADDGRQLEISYQGKNAKKGDIWKVLISNTEDKKAKSIKMNRLDGKSIGHQKTGSKTRVIFDIKEEKIIGIHYDNYRSIHLGYFHKKQKLTTTVSH